jgi:hypothetical protein
VLGRVAGERRPVVIDAEATCWKKGAIAMLSQACWLTGSAAIERSAHSRARSSEWASGWRSCETP